MFVRTLIIQIGPICFYVEPETYNLMGYFSILQASYHALGLCLAKQK